VVALKNIAICKKEKEKERGSPFFFNLVV